MHAYTQHKKKKKSLGVCVHACVRACTSILSYIDCSLVEVVHGHFSYNRIKFIHLTASKLTKANTDVDALKGKIDDALGKPLEQR